jgi:hypothetical protein
MRENEIELPDYLPSRYRSWLHLYLEIQRLFAERGETIQEDSEVTMYELGDDEEQQMLRQYSEEVICFYQHFPVSLIKSRALDYVLSKLPSFEVMHEIRNRTLANLPYSYGESIYQSLNGLLSICPRN